MGCPKLTERDYYRLHNCTEKTAYSGFFHTVSDDTIGNRKTYDTTESGSNVQSVYTANNLNQYTNITNPTQAPTYDADGNMLTMTLASGSWTNTFNAENRIIAQEKSDAKLEYVYDYMGRRVEKKVYSGSTGNWVLAEHLKFVYDEYKKIESLDALNSNAVSKKNVWNKERLLAETIGANTFYAMADANRNVTEYIDSTGAIQEHTEYSPFGKVTVQNGTMAGEFDYGFSSEFRDIKTGLVYYNYRYYSPELGRWLSKDSIEEKGGANLYLFAINQSTNLWDFLGNKVTTKTITTYSPVKTKTHTAKSSICKADNCLYELFNTYLVKYRVKTTQTITTDTGTAGDISDIFDSLGDGAVVATAVVVCFLVADDATVIGIADDPLIPAALGLGGLVTVVCKTVSAVSEPDVEDITTTITTKEEDDIIKTTLLSSKVGKKIGTCGTSSSCKK